MQVRIIICLLFLTMIVVAVLYGLREVADSVDLATCLAIWGAAALVEIGIAFTWDRRQANRFQINAPGLPVFRALSLCTCRRQYPGAAAEIAARQAESETSGTSFSQTLSGITICDSNSSKRCAASPFLVS